MAVVLRYLMGKLIVVRIFYNCMDDETGPENTRLVPKNSILKKITKDTC